jgi:ADP-heptose:LPS heptosyltransferase
MKIKHLRLIDCWLGEILAMVLSPIFYVMSGLVKPSRPIKIKKDLLIIKLLGGGSLVLVYPCLLSLRVKYPETRIMIMTTAEVAPFARILDIFDDIIQINHQNILSLLYSSVMAYFKTWRVQTIINLEVYSKLSLVFSALHFACDRVGFYFEDNLWRKCLLTHLIYFNRFAGVFQCYERLFALFGIKPASSQECQRRIVHNLETHENYHYRICIGHGCSSLCPERMLTVQQWIKIFKEKLEDKKSVDIYFLGSKNDHAIAQDIINELSSRFQNVNLINCCGKLTLAESLSILSACSEFWGIDSALLHFARLFSKRCVSWWGPTDPETILKSYPGTDDRIYYEKTSCSPCIHISAKPPCHGENVCMQNLFNDHKKDWSGLIKKLNNN